MKRQILEAVEHLSKEELVDLSTWIDRKLSIIADEEKNSPRELQGHEKEEDDNLLLYKESLYNHDIDWDVYPADGW